MYQGIFHKFKKIKSSVLLLFKCNYLTNMYKKYTEINLTNSISPRIIYLFIYLPTYLPIYISVLPPTTCSSIPLQ